MDKAEFVQNIRKSLVACGVDFCSLRKSKAPLGLGISGGADSVSLFLSLCEILKEESVPLVCVTVNHHIRAEEETNSDMFFVQELCAQKKNEGFDVSLDVYDLKENQVNEAVEKRNSGVEDGARFVRYECFEKSILNHGISFFCLAHNADDNFETILMRFLKGSSSGGIEKVRGKYIRPLMDVSRKEIENFLQSVGQSFCTDSTNLSDLYLRNKIRHKLVPFLDENFPLWQNAVFTGDEKRRDDSSFLDRMASSVPLSPELSEEGNEPLWNRVLSRELNEAGVTERIPSAFLKEVLLETRKSVSSKKPFSMRFSTVSVEFDGVKLFVKSYEKSKTDSGFFDIIEDCGEYLFPFGKIAVWASPDDRIIRLEYQDEKGRLKTVTLDKDFPFVIRSPQLGESKGLFVVE